MKSGKTAGQVTVRLTYQMAVHTRGRMYNALIGHAIVGKAIKYYDIGIPPFNLWGSSIVNRGMGHAHISAKLGVRVDFP